MYNNKVPILLFDKHQLTLLQIFQGKILLYMLDSRLYL